MTSIIGGVPGKKIAPLTERKENGIHGKGHPGSAIAPLLSRKTELSAEELKEKNDQRHMNRKLIADAKRK